ncbi:flagellar motor stator protein MotA [Pleomorphomonas sp. JP5]|uniref:flagellar motor stator protein MotA n=1 Tax=Pleomorphomonas sp. JP5 TaxID=2942998 RepID=UPI002044258C|nr:flagellar motor stator protein MotA [Pleomorphomonas sp. JP5]MCM5556385.1 flagellar motor stator protein MotA [Pleomorphomonas sp. JP5]
MGSLIGFIIAIGSLLGGYAALGGHLTVLWQPWEFVIIGGTALGIFIVGNTMRTVRDTGRGVVDAVLGNIPRREHYLGVLEVLYALMRELRSKGRSDVEKHIEDPENSDIFRKVPFVAKDKEMRAFICDYFRLIIVGNARPHEVEQLMDEEIQTIAHERLMPYLALGAIAEALPALGIVAAVLGVIKAMGAIDQSPQILGALIGAALVGTFGGIFLSYGVVAPIAGKIKVTRERQLAPYILIKQTLIASMNGAVPQIALEYGRKTIPAHQRPTIDDVEDEVISSPVPATAKASEPAQRSAA